MGDLENYSIETDQTVLLSFRDGRKLRVRSDRLARHLRPHDLVVVRRALRLRRDFLRLHMPKTAVLLLAAGLLAALMVGTRVVARLFLHQNPADPSHTFIVRSQAESRPDAEPAPTSPASTPKLAAKHHQAKPALAAAHNAATGSPASTLPAGTPPTTVNLTAADPTPAPSATPAPSTSSDPGTTAVGPAASQPAPSPTPAPDPGQVLGASTGPQ